MRLALGLTISLTTLPSPHRGKTIGAGIPDAREPGPRGGFGSSQSALIAALAQLGQKLGTSRSAPTFY